MSHNPQAPVVYDLCDRLGLLIMDEASDEWEFPKRKWVKGWNKGNPPMTVLSISSKNGLNRM